MSAARDKALAAWGDPLPDLIETLVSACETKSLRKVAAELDVSAALISLAVRNRHHASLAYIERKVMDLDVKSVSCPVLGNITRQECKSNCSRPFMAINPLYISLYRACRECGHATRKENENDR